MLKLKEGVSAIPLLGTYPQELKIGVEKKAIKKLVH